MRECTVTIPHIRQMPLSNGMLLGSTPLHNPHPLYQPGRVGHNNDIQSVPNRLHGLHNLGNSQIMSGLFKKVIHELCKFSFLCRSQQAQLKHAADSECWKCIIAKIDLSTPSESYHILHVHGNKVNMHAGSECACKLKGKYQGNLHLTPDKVSGVVKCKLPCLQNKRF